jgi:hypothetical protein
MMADFKINRIRFTWKDTWATSTAYTKDDIVRYRGKSYVCLVGHTASADFNTDLNYIDVSTTPDEPAPKWGLWLDGYEWRNNWSTSTLYNLGDYVRYNSIVYICTTSHTSATTLASGLEADQANWTRYAVTDNWLKAWAINTRYRLNDLVRYGGTIYRCNFGHTSSSTTTFPGGLEANQSYWDAVLYANDWQTDWAPVTRYKLGDVVRYGGIIYKCTAGHVSSATATIGIDPDIANWTVVHTGVDYKFTWTASTRYKLNDVVKQGADLYICIAAHTSTSTFDTASFKIWVPGLEFANAWLSTVAYDKGDVVTYGGYQYTSNVQNNTNNIPSTDLISWTLVVKNYNIMGDWDPISNYRTGDLVRRNGYLYVAVNDSSSIETTDTSKWELVNPGIQWRGNWIESQVYVVGDVVTYYSTAYICIVKHTATPLLAPTNDTTNIYWVIYVRGDQFETLQNQGDIQTYNAGQWTATPVGADGNLLKTRTLSTNNYLAVPAWDNWGIIGKVYYVAPTGIDTASYGTTISTPWRTVKYACGQVTGPATIFIKTGTYGESLPIRVPAGVALVGDELRGTVIQPAKIINCIATAASSSTGIITVNTTVGISANDPIQFVTETLITTALATAASGNKITLAYVANLYVNENIIFNGASLGGLISDQVYYIKTFDSATQTITVSASYDGPTFTVTDGQGAMTATAGGFGGLNIGQTYYVIGSTITPTSFKVANINGGTAAVSLSDSTNQSCNVYGGDAIKNMFLCSNATGIRNMTLSGLIGGLGSPNQYGTRRPTAGAYVSLDPGTGPNDTSVQITTKSPYAQNVTMFGQGCVGVKIDGTLHNGGNKSIVANDFTTILSSGIGAWCTGSGSLTELVSVFAYYGHCGYLAENGGRIRATNGNTSYGNYGCVAEGFDTTETPITATVNNRNQQAQIASAFIGEATNKILKFEFSNAGQQYTGATYAFGGSGTGASAVADEFRDGGIYEVRILGSDFAAGGLGYVTSVNQAQAGNTQTITLASNDQNTFATYYGMRLIVTSGTGVGQYGYIAGYDTVSKVATIANESITQQTSSSTSATDNTITVPTTAGFTPGSPIVFVPTQQNTTAFNTVRTIATMTTAYIAGQTLYVVQMGAGSIAVGMTLTGAGITSGTYIVANNAGVGSGSTWQINVAQVVGSQVAPITITGTNNLVTLTSSAGMTIGEQIVFSGTTFGGINAGQTYYIINAIIGNQITISDTYQGPVKTLTNGTGQMPAIAGGMLGGLTAGQIYYVIATSYSPTKFSVSTVFGGTIQPVATQTYGSKMDVHAVGWQNVISGTPAVSLLDSTSVYSIEPCIRFSQPQYSSNITTLPTTGWVSIAYGGGKYIAITAAGLTATSTTGSLWTAGTTLPTGTYSKIRYGGGFFYAITAGSSSIAFSIDGNSWTSGNTTLGGGHADIAWGNNNYIALQTTSSAAASSSINGSTWNAVTLPTTATWTSIVYSNSGVWVAIAGNNSNIAAYSLDNGTTWLNTYSTDGGATQTNVQLPSSANWISVTWGNGRFVAIATGSSAAAYSFDGKVWIASTMPVTASWQQITYGQGTFIVVGNGTSTALSSPDGVVWTQRTLPTTGSYSGVAFGNTNSAPIFAVVSGTSSGLVISCGAQAFGRAVVASNKISSIKLLEPGSGYISASVTATDPNPTSFVTTLARIGNKVLGNPTFVNRGTGYRTSTTTVTVQVGDGYADIYQPSKFLTVSNIALLPTPGAALTINGNPNQYRIVVINDLGGNKAQFQISPPLTILAAPEHNTSINIRQRYSQCRITGHDFLLIGTGNREITNYPNVDVNTALPYQQISENNGGRVFQTSTDQDGNFKVGNLFAVQQASGIVTISADQLSLTGLQTLSLGGFQLGTNSVTITQFSTDSYFTANSDNIVPTQRAIKAYISRNIAGGGSNAQAGAIVAGTFGVGGPNRIYSSTQTQLFVRNSMRFTNSTVQGKVVGGANGTILAKSFFAHGFAQDGQSFSG